MSDRNSTAVADYSSAYDSLPNTYSDTQQTDRQQIDRQLAETSQLQAVEQLSEEVADLRHHEAQTSQRLRTRVNWLTGLLAATLVILGGGLVGITLSLRNEQAALQATQAELADQLAAAAEAEANAQQLNRLEQQLQSLNQQAQTITAQAKELAEGAANIPPTISSARWADLQARLESLEQSIQDNVAGRVPTESVGEQFDRIDKVLADFRSIISTLTQPDDTSETVAPEADPAIEESAASETAE